MAGRIFISYRREDTRGFSLGIFNYLPSQFGADEIFMDVNSIAPGRDFIRVLEVGLDLIDPDKKQAGIEIKEAAAFMLLLYYSTHHRINHFRT